MSLSLSGLMSLSLSGQDKGLDVGLVGFWPFELIEKGGKMEDISKFNVDGITSGAHRTAGIRGNGIRFDGKGDFVTILDSGGAVPAHIRNLGEGSISLWFKLDRLPDGKGIQPIFYMGAWNNCLNMFDAANQGIILEVGHHPVHWKSKRLYFTIFANGCSLPSFCFDSWVDMEADRWYHFVAVVGEDFNTGYLDGRPMEFIHYNFGNSSYSQFFENAVQKDVIWLGKGYWDDGTYFLDGAIDELRIYDRALDKEEVKELYLSTLSTSIPPDLNRERLSIFPNPVTDRLQIDWTGTGEDRMERILLTDLSGRIILEREPSAYLELYELKGGSYQLIIESTLGRTVRSIVKLE